MKFLSLFPKNTYLASKNSYFDTQNDYFAPKKWFSYSYSYLYLQKLTCYIKNIRDITMDNKLTTVPDDAATRETNPKKIKCLISPLWVPL